MPESPLERPRPVVLCILDGVGVREAADGNAIRSAATPALAKLRADYPTTTLRASGAAVGMDERSPGCGEAGHVTLGAGRAIPSTRSRIDATVREHKLGRVPAIDQLTRICGYDGCPLHLIGLLSTHGSHAAMDHLLALVDLCDFQEIPVIIHAILDGYDSAPRSALGLLDRLQLHLEGKRASIGTLSGRHWAMDGDGRWDRVHRAFHAIVRDNVLGPTARRESSVFDAVSLSYREGAGDGQLEPVRIGEYEGIVGDFSCEFGMGKPVWEWTGQACGLAFHHRGDGIRQLSQMLTREGVPDEVANDLLMDRHHPVRAFREHCFAGLTNFGEDVALPAAFPREPVGATLGEICAAAGKRQLRCAESEKRFHVTTFFNGWRERPFDGEDREIVPSPRLVERYDQKPEMNAAKVAAKVVSAIAAGTHDLIVVNLGNVDLVARGAGLETTVAAVEAVDRALGQIADATLTAGGALLVTADHGNGEAMLDAKGRPTGAHTDAPVPLIYASKDAADSKLRAGGDLADIAPTVLELLGIDRPPEMTGTSLRIPR